MVISRNGMDFVLTEDELFCAYKEQQHAWDLSQMSDTYDLDELHDPNLIVPERLKTQFYEDLAYNYRWFLTKWGEEDEETLDEAESRALRIALGQLSASLSKEQDHEQ